jgi:polyferredoxin
MLMQKKKSKAIFLLLAFLAVAIMVAFSVFIAEEMILMALLSVIIFIGIFGLGFTLKKKYRENGWL